MNENGEIPSKLYKYRRFNDRALDQLIFDQLCFSDPKKFNDPLDTRPSLLCDLEEDALENILRKLVEQRSCKEMQGATKKIKHIGSWTIRDEKDYSQKYAVRILAEISYNATDPEYDNMDDPKKFLLGIEIENELLSRYDKGIVCFAESPQCPLMWSHYGDQHKGICFGYSIPDDVSLALYKVDYRAPDRKIKASIVGRMLDGDEAALREVDQAVLLRKAGSWEYEKEWRLIGPQGVKDSPLELDEVIFGMRCPSSVRYAVIMSLDKRPRPVNFFEIRALSGEFQLAKHEIDVEEEIRFLPRRARQIYEDFESIDIDT